MNPGESSLQIHDMSAWAPSLKQAAIMILCMKGPLFPLSSYSTFDFQMRWRPAERRNTAQSSRLGSGSGGVAFG